MGDIGIREGRLVVHIQGVGQFLALEGEVSSPPEQIAAVEVSPPTSTRSGLAPVGATNLAGVITAGRFLQHREWAFWDVHGPGRWLAVRLHDEQCARLVVGVDDPAAAAISAALDRR